MYRILYFSGYRSTLYERSGKTINRIFDFEPTEESTTLFTKYLENTPLLTTIIIIDIVEEDFYFEAAPQIRGAELQAYIKRSLSKTFRNNPRTLYTFQERDPKNKKRKNVCLSALTNPGLIKETLVILLKYNIPIAGIYSAPLLNAHLTKKLKIKDKKVILITQHIPSAIRYTFIDQGHMKFTRSAKISYADIDSNNYLNICHKVITDLEDTLAFLYNQNHLNYDDDELSIKAILSPPIQKEFTPLLSDQTNLDVKLITTTEAVTKMGLINKGGELSCPATIACLPTLSWHDHYSLPIERKSYHQKLAYRAINICSVAVLLLSIMVSSINISDGFITYKRAETIKEEATALQQKFETYFGPYKEKINSGLIMQDTVLIYNALKQYEQLTPETFYIQLSDIISNEKHQEITLSKIEWALIDGVLDARYKLNEEEEGMKENADSDALLMDTIDTTLMETDPFSSSLDTTADQPKSKILEYVALIEGNINLKYLSKREAVNIMQSFIDQLDNLPSTRKVKAIKLPIDIRSSSEYSNVRDNHTNRHQNENQMSPFIITLIMEVSLNA